MRPAIIFTALLISLCFKGLCQPNLHFNYITVEQGLPSNTVSAIYQDHMGFMWIGSWGEGVSRYDGYDFKTYESNPDILHTISDNSINVIYEDSNHNLWIGTRNGISLYNREQEIFTRFLTSADNTMNGFRSIFEDSKARIWIAGNELYQFQSADSSFQIVNRSPDDSESLNPGRVRRILEDQKRQLWILTDSGLSLYHDQTGKFTRFPAPGQIAGKIRTLCIDHLDRFWLTTSTEGIWQFDPYKSSFSNFSEQATKYGEYNEFIVSLYDIIQDDNQNIWAITDGSGLLNLNPEANSIYVYTYDPILSGALSDNNLISIYSDHQNNLWVGSYNTGLNVYNSDQVFLNRYYHNPSDPNSLSSNLVTSVYEDKQGDLWVATDEGGVNRLILDQHGTITSNVKISSKSGILPMNKTWGLIQDHEGWIWVNTHYGSVRFHPETMEFSNPKGILLYQDRNDYYWFKGERGIVSYNAKTDESIGYTSNLFFAQLLEASNGDLWISDLSEGLKFVDKESNSIVTKIPGMATGVCEGKSGTLWVATMKDGLIKYEPEYDKITKFKRENGFLTDDCRGGLLKDRDGFIWIGSNEGIIRFNPKSNEMVNFGLINDNLKHYIKPLTQTSDGKIYLGGSKGMISFEPDKIDEPSIPPKPLFTNLQLFDRDLSVGENSILRSNILETDELTLNYKQNVFTIAYAALSFKPTQTLYSYKLEGYDEDWREPGTQLSATYTNLDAGSYDFKVRAGNLNGDWNPEEASIQINVLPPPWKTWWAYSLYAVAACCMLLLWRRNLVRRERLKTKLQLEHLELEKVKEVDQLKTQFFANISHEFRTPLTLILGPLKQMYEGSFKGDTRTVIAVMIRNSRRLLNLINQLLDFSKLDAGGINLQTSQQDMVKFTRNIFSAFESAAQSRRIRYMFQSNQEVIPCYFDDDLMEKVIINLLSNAFKFTGQEGSIAIKLNAGVSDHLTDQGAGVVEIRIEDTGQGIPAEKIPYVFDRFYQVDPSSTRLREGTGIGLALSKELVELHYGSIRAESESGVGTTFIVCIPLGRSHLEDDELVLRHTYQVTEINPLEPLPENPSNGSGQKSKDDLPVVLIIEDNQDMRLYLNEILADNYHMLEAENGSKGLEMAFEHIPDLIISDVMMPETDGHELCRTLKVDERTCHIPIVLLTARAGEDSKIEGLKTGANDYITKPFSPVELKVRVQNLMELQNKLAEQFQKSRSINIKVGTVSSLDQRFLQRVTDILENHRSDADYSVEEFAREIGMSRSQLHRKLKALTGHPASEFIRTYRFNYAHVLLKKDFDNIAQIAYACGFKNPSYFTEGFKKQFGMLPSEVAKEKR